MTAMHLIQMGNATIAGVAALTKRMVSKSLRLEALADTGIWDYIGVVVPLKSILFLISGDIYKI